MGNRAEAYLVYGIPLEVEIDEDQWQDGLFEFVYSARAADPYYPVDVVRTSTYDFPQYIVILPGSENYTDWDGPLMINELPEPSPVAIKALKNWIERNDLANHVDGEEGWWLAAMWG